MLQVVHDRAGPVSVLAALKHPLASGGTDTATWRALTRTLERLVLRGPRPPAGFVGLRAAAEAYRDKERDEVAERHHALWPEILSGIGMLETSSEALTGLFDAPTASVSDLVRAHIGFAEALAESASDSGALRLWAGDAGEALAGFVAELAEFGDALDPIAPGHYAALFETLLAGTVVRPRFGAHPRLSILGPLEARLQRFDVMIMGGLNEGSWPADANVDPWMGRPMRADFGLPSPERRIGLSAHDFVQGFAPKRSSCPARSGPRGPPRYPRAG